MSTPSNTPNVVIESPKARKIARTSLDVVGVVLGTVIIADASSDLFNVVAFTAPAMAVWTYLRFAFGLAVDNANTPKGN